MPQVLRRQHDDRRVVGDVINWMDSTFDLDAIVDGAPARRLRQNYKGRLEDAKTICDGLVQQLHPHVCSEEHCGEWTR